MFSNTVNLRSTDGTINTVLLDGPANRRTLRGTGNGQYSFTIAHGESNENGSLPTQRSNVRVSQVFDVTDTAQTATAYAQLTLSIPKDTVSAAQVKALVAKLLCFLELSENDNGDAPSLADADLTAVDRLYAGEP